MSWTRNTLFILGLGAAGYAGHLYTKGLRVEELDQALKDGQAHLEDVINSHRDHLLKNPPVKIDIDDSPGAIGVYSSGDGNVIISRLPDGRYVVNGSVVGAPSHGASGAGSAGATSPPPLSAPTPSASPTPSPSASPGPSSGQHGAASPSGTPPPKVFSDEILGSGVRLWYTDRKTFENVEAAVQLVYTLYDNPSFRQFMETASGNQKERIPRVIREFYERGMQAHQTDDYASHSTSRQEQVRTLLERYLSSLTINGAKKITASPPKTWWGWAWGSKEPIIDYSGSRKGNPMMVPVSEGVRGYAQRDITSTLEMIEEEESAPQTPSPSQEPSSEPYARFRMQDMPETRSGANDARPWAQESPVRREQRARRQYGGFFGQAPRSTSPHGMSVAQYHRWNGGRN